MLLESEFQSPNKASTSQKRTWLLAERSKDLIHFDLIRFYLRTSAGNSVQLIANSLIQLSSESIRRGQSDLSSVLSITTFHLITS